MRNKIFSFQKWNLTNIWESNGNKTIRLDVLRQPCRRMVKKQWTQIWKTTWREIFSQQSSWMNKRLTKQFKNFLKFRGSISCLFFQQVHWTRLVTSIILILLIPVCKIICQLSNKSHEIGQHQASSPLNSFHCRDSKSFETHLLLSPICNKKMKIMMTYAINFGIK